MFLDGPEIGKKIVQIKVRKNILKKHPNFFRSFFVRGLRALGILYKYDSISCLYLFDYVSSRCLSYQLKILMINPIRNRCYHVMLYYERGINQPPPDRGK